MKEENLLLIQRATLMFADYLINENRLSDAAEQLELLLDKDQFWRSGVEKLIRVYIASDKYVSAYKVYNRYKDALYSDLGITPDTKLVKLIESIS